MVTRGEENGEGGLKKRGVVAVAVVEGGVVVLVEG